MIWSWSTRVAGGHEIDRVLGPVDRIETVLDAYLANAGETGATEPYDVPAPSLENRVDLRALTTVTIDPETAKDFDDAISVERDGERLRAYIHIADVAHYVAAGTALDRGAMARAVSVYVPGRVAPMLPPELADDLCSLRPNEDRPALTIEIPFDGELSPGAATFYRSVIRSDARLTYGEAQRIVSRNGTNDADVSGTVVLAERIAGELRRRRFARGALRVESPEAAFSFDGDGGVANAWLDAEPAAHALVEELMILANEAVAGFLRDGRAETLYRVHEPPEAQSIVRLATALTELGVPTPPTPEAESLTPRAAALLAGEISERVQAYVESSGRGRFAFPSLVLRALKQARYDPANLGHSGLQSAAYCHFTSPIRRYPDLVCHRALLRALGAGDDPPPEDVGDAAEQISVRERLAARVEYGADAICLAWLLDQRLLESGWEVTFEGEITGLIGAGLFVRFADVFEGFVPSRTIRDDYYELTPLGTGLQGRRGGRVFRLGDAVAVRVEGVRRMEGKVELRLASS